MYETKRYRLHKLKVVKNFKDSLYLTFISFSTSVYNIWFKELSETEGKQLNNETCGKGEVGSSFSSIPYLDRC